MVERPVTPPGPSPCALSLPGHRISHHLLYPSILRLPATATAKTVKRHNHDNLQLPPSPSRTATVKGHDHQSAASSAISGHCLFIFSALSVQMDRTLADELYADTLEVSSGGSGPMASADHILVDSYDRQLDHTLHDDDPFWGSSPEEQNNLSDLDREWRRRRDQFHTIGYRDGLTAGKEASAQEGFNIGFRESVVAGYNWGLVRGITSVYTCLPHGLRERLMEAQGDRDKMQSLHESVLALSTADSLKLFHDEDISMKRSAEETEGAEFNPHMEGSQSQSSSTLNSYFGELKSLILKHPAMQVNLGLDQ